MKISRNSEIATLAIWLVIGLCVGAIQFAVIETTYRIAENNGPEFLYDLSDQLAWPAGLIYEAAEKPYLKKGLDQAIEQGGEHAERAKFFQAGFDEKYGIDDEWTDALWTFTGDAGLETDVPWTVEYLIYGGVCLLWGLFFGLVGYIVTRSVMAALPDRPTPPTAT
jgi:hypothetical protein